MKRHVQTFICGAIIFLLAGLAARAELPDQSKDQNLFFKAKALVFTGDWAGVRAGMESYLKTYPSGKMEDEAFFWLARSLDRLAREAKDASSVIDLKQRAFTALDRLVKEHPQSLWRDDAREFQVTVAGSLAVLGEKEQLKFLEDVVTAGGKNEIQVKTAALRSILELDSRTALAVFGNFLKAEENPELRKQAVTLLGGKFTREIITLLEERQKSDPDAEVRKEAGAGLEKIRTRLIPVQVGYYCFETEVTDLTQYAKVPEGQVARFAVPHGRTGSEARAKREIERVFKDGLRFSGSKATMMSSILEPMSQVSHLIAGFRIALNSDSLIKTEGEISGRIRFGDVDVPFKVDAANDLILAARKGSRQAVMFLEMSPAEPIERVEGHKSLDISSRPSQPSGKSGQEPVYYYAFNIKGAVIHSNPSQLESEAMEFNLIDYGPAKAEIPGKGGTWTLIGEIIQQIKENVLIGRRARLIRPDGTTAAEGAEIRVPIGRPERFNTEEKAADAVEEAAESVYPLENGGWIRSNRPGAPVGDAVSGILDFGTGKASLPGPGGAWVLSGRLTLLISSGQIMAYQAVLTDPKGKITAQGALLFVPVKEPDKYHLAVERVF